MVLGSFVAECSRWSGSGSSTWRAGARPPCASGLRRQARIRHPRQRPFSSSLHFCLCSSFPALLVPSPEAVGCPSPAGGSGGVLACVCAGSLVRTCARVCWCEAQEGRARHGVGASLWGQTRVAESGQRSEGQACRPAPHRDRCSSSSRPRGRWAGGALPEWFSLQTPQPKQPRPASRSQGEPSVLRPQPGVSAPLRAQASGLPTGPWDSGLGPNQG